MGGPSDRFFSFSAFYLILRHARQMSLSDNEHSLQGEIARKDKGLDALRAELKRCNVLDSEPGMTDEHAQAEKHASFDSDHLPSHSLLLLADTALPLGSFAFSSGLESFLAHHSPAQNARPDILHQFLHSSLKSLGSTTLPYLIATYNRPARLEELDDILDACILCPVAKRASKSQGRALITVWERSLKAETAPSSAKEALQLFCMRLKGLPGSKLEDAPELNAHFPLIYAVVCAAQGLSLHESAYTYLLNHAKAIASAAVRASVLGPYAAQGLLGSKWLREEIEETMQSEWDTPIEDAGQAVPALDVWIGRHELLYSRIFNS